MSSNAFPELERDGALRDERLDEARATLAMHEVEVATHNLLLRAADAVGALRAAGELFEKLAHPKTAASAQQYALALMEAIARLDKAAKAAKTGSAS